MRETWVQSMGCEDPLEKEMATHSSVLAWRIPETEEPGGLQSSWRSQRVRHNWVMHTYLYSATYFFRLIHVAVIFISLLMLGSKRPVYDCLALCFQFPVGGHLDCFPFLHIINKTSMGTHVQIFLWLNDFTSRSGSVGPQGRCVFDEKQQSLF